jgi:NAD(P)-dependent dehydrogenase (short-subunit alcohol dehydrogenase family)
MSRIFITGSSTGLGQLAAQRLVAMKHDVVLHARDERKAREALAAVPGAADVAIGDLSKLDEVKRLADDVNRLGRFDAIIHNAGLYRASADDILKVNTLAPYVLTCLIEKPQRLVYLSSGMHRGGKPVIEKVAAGRGITYSDSKLHVVMLAKAVARRWPDVQSNAVDPGWVPTRMGGANAPDDLEEGVETQVWLAVSDDANAKVSGRYFHHMKQDRQHRDADDVALQNSLIEACAKVTGVTLPL